MSAHGYFHQVLRFNKVKSVQLPPGGLIFVLVWLYLKINNSSFGILRFKWVCHYLGDFGGPLVQNIDGVYYLVATSSYNTECGNPNSPTVHSRIDYHLSWITAGTADGIKCGDSSRK